MFQATNSRPRDKEKNRFLQETVELSITQLSLQRTVDHDARKAENDMDFRGGNTEGNLAAVAQPSQHSVRGE